MPAPSAFYCLGVDVTSLQRVDLFKSLSKPELQQLAQWADEVEVAEGTVLGREGAFAYEFFVIEEGAAEVVVGGEKVTELGPGEWFGEIGLLASERRTGTVTAISPMRLIVIFGPNFRELARSMPAVAATIDAELRRRLERAS